MFTNHPNTFAEPLEEPMYARNAKAQPTTMAGSGRPLRVVQRKMAGALRLRESP